MKKTKTLFQQLHEANLKLQEQATALDYKDRLYNDLDIAFKEQAKEIESKNLLLINDVKLISDLFKEQAKEIEYYQKESEHWNNQAVEIGNKVTELEKEIERLKGEKSSKTKSNKQ